MAGQEGLTTLANLASGIGAGVAGTAASAIFTLRKPPVKYRGLFKAYVGTLGLAFMLGAALMITSSRLGRETPVSDSSVKIMIPAAVGALVVSVILKGFLAMLSA